MGRGRRLRVLVVEDDHATSQMMRLRLEVDGFEAEVAENGERALRAIDSFSPDIAICDVHLTGISGLEVCRRLRAGIGPYRHLPVILLTGLDEDAELRSVLALGDMAYMKKPFVAGQLRNQILQMAEPPQELTGSRAPLGSREEVES
jgi:two-component system phosphate regulon response regulator PhoB